MDYEAIVGLGANLGSPAATVRRALQGIGTASWAGNFASSRLYRTSPVSTIPQPDYINAVCRFVTSLPPRQLLEELQQIERQLGKMPKPREAPRPIDIDLLFYGTLKVEEPDLVIPHPRWSERLFVLVPLMEVTGWDLQEQIASCTPTTVELLV